MTHRQPYLGERPLTLVVLLVSVFLAVAAGCRPAGGHASAKSPAPEPQGSGEEPEPPAPPPSPPPSPPPVPKPPEPPRPQQSPLTLLWKAPGFSEDGSRLTDLAGYRVYQGVRPGEYNTVVDLGRTTRYVTKPLPDGTYYFAVAAFDRAGNESELSREVRFTLP